MYERFTERSRKVMQLANEEAHRCNHEFIDTEHVLLGLLNEENGVGATALLNLNVGFDAVRDEIFKLVQRGRDRGTMGYLPQTPRAKKAIQFAMEEARNLNQKYFGTEHILLGLLREQDGVAATALSKLGVTLEQARKEIQRMLDSHAHDNKLNWPCRELDPAEEELVEICRAMRAEEQRHFAHLKGLSREAWWEQDMAAHPATKYVPQFLEFEHRHHGTHAGLMAARQVLMKARDFLYGPGDVRELGRRHILSVLGDYAAAGELPHMLHDLEDARPEPMCEAFLRQLAVDEQAGERNRACAGYRFGRWCEMVDCRQFNEDYLYDPDTAAGPILPRERTFFEQWLAAVPPAEKLAALKAEAAERLELLSNCPADLKEPAIVLVRDEPAIIQFSPELTEQGPAIRNLAAGLLFKMRHLKVGDVAPDLQLELIDGRRWSLGEHAGKVVVIQFAHSGHFAQLGCGPFVKRQPDLRSLIDEHGESVEVLSIMVDYRREATAKTVESAKLSWSVYWDGVPGSIAMKWGVTHVPTDYVVGPDGRIAGRHLQGKRLKARVARLLRGEALG